MSYCKTPDTYVPLIDKRFIHGIDRPDMNYLVPPDVDSHMIMHKRKGYNSEIYTPYTANEHGEAISDNVSHNSTSKSRSFFQGVKRFFKDSSSIIYALISFATFMASLGFDVVATVGTIFYGILNTIAKILFILGTLFKTIPFFLRRIRGLGGGNNHGGGGDDDDDDPSDGDGGKPRKNQHRKNPSDSDKKTKRPINDRPDGNDRDGNGEQVIDNHDPIVSNIRIEHQHQEGSNAADADIVVDESEAHVHESKSPTVKESNFAVDAPNNDNEKHNTSNTYQPIHSSFEHDFTYTITTGGTGYDDYNGDGTFRPYQSIPTQLHWDNEYVNPNFSDSSTFVYNIPNLSGTDPYFFKSLSRTAEDFARRPAANILALFSVLVHPSMGLGGLA